MGKQSLFIFLISCLITSCSNKRELIFTGRTLGNDSISIVERESGTNLTEKKLHTFSSDLIIINDVRELKGKQKDIVLNIHIDSSGIVMLDTMLFIPDSIKQPNILFEIQTLAKSRRRVILRDYFYLIKY